jgi:hypothetical protein
MLEIQIQLLSLWWATRTATGRRVEAMRGDERGEVTATTAIIVILVIAAIAAGGVIAAKINANANKVPSP